MNIGNKLSYALLSLLIFFQCCANPKTPKSSDKITIDTVSTEKIIEVFGNEADIKEKTKSYEMDFNNVTKDPFLHFYSTTVKGVQVKESSTIDGEGSFTSMSLSIIGPNPDFFSDEKRLNADIDEREGIKYLIIFDSEYELAESKDVSFEAYSKFDYIITTVNKIGKRDQDEYWNDLIYNYEYNKSFIATSKTGLYDKVFESDAFLDIVLGEQRKDITKWNHTLRHDTIETDEVQFVSWHASETEPLRFDSIIFVVYTFEDIYMGGAHGIYTTSAYNFDVETGNLITLSDLVGSNLDILYSQLIEKAKEVYELNGIELGSNEEPSSFIIYSDGIAFTFPPYSLGGGFWEKDVFLTFDELRPILIKDLYSINQY